MRPPGREPDDNGSAGATSAGIITGAGSIDAGFNLALGPASSIVGAGPSSSVGLPLFFITVWHECCVYPYLARYLCSQLAVVRRPKLILTRAPESFV